MTFKTGGKWHAIAGYHSTYEAFLGEKKFQPHHKTLYQHQHGDYVNFRNQMKCFVNIMRVN